MMLWSESCDVDADNRTNLLSKVIVGAEKLYIVSKVWKYAPKHSDRERWHQRLTEVFVCDPTTGRNSCAWLRNRAGRGGPEGPGGRARGARAEPADRAAARPATLAGAANRPPAGAGGPPQMPKSDSKPDRMITYKTVGNAELKLRIFYPKNGATHSHPGALLFSLLVPTTSSYHLRPSRRSKSGIAQAVMTRQYMLTAAPTIFAPMNKNAARACA